MTTFHQRLPLAGAASWIKTVAFIAAMLVTGIGSAAAETPAGYMQRVANQLIEAQKSGTEGDFATVIRSHADVPTIALTALGSYAQSLNKSDRPAYYAGMINFISRYAAKEAPKYPVLRAIMVGQTKETAGGIYVDSRISLRSGENYDVRWRIVRRGSVFKVRDAEIIGFEMTSFLNNLFQNYISENGGNPRTLVIALNR
ncbi:MAG: ABC transporter substrate-binding protein [Hyphomicrobium sp.]|jgi:phospholipid transport system substrate-binding protein|uniref:ABC transporter substrate-binding protein n=1 Tax=Hyphomicrobium sp. TaxID=82 RepID=UPI0025BEC3F1|nr:ABC transporter substrate-binding protein [Hyphomicrobium sp.]MBX9861565.1 ABC transporter substrate-binding protein [Hyphomicrobium sp.]